MCLCAGEQQGSSHKTKTFSTAQTEWHQTETNIAALQHRLMEGPRPRLYPMATKSISTSAETATSYTAVSVACLHQSSVNSYRTPPEVSCTPESKHYKQDNPCSSAIKSLLQCSYTKFLLGHFIRWVLCQGSFNRTL